MDLAKMTKKEIKLGGHSFVLYMSAQEIAECVDHLGNQLNKNYKDKKPLLISILDGAFMFTADLIRHLDFEHDLIFVKIKSYEGMESSGKIKIMTPIDKSIEGREILIIEDIVDTGATLHEFCEIINQKNPADISICSLLLKPEANQHRLPLKFVGKEIPNDFIVGYGMDLDGAGRNYRDFYVIKD